MLLDQYGGRKAIQAFLKTGKLVGIRLPPTGAPGGGGQRRAVPQRREGRPNKEARRQKYLSRLLADLESGSLERRTTRLAETFWGLGLEPKEEPKEVPKNHQWAAIGLRQAQERRQRLGGTPGSGVSADPPPRTFRRSRSPSPSRRPSQRYPPGAAPYPPAARRGGVELRSVSAARSPSRRAWVANSDASWNWSEGERWRGWRQGAQWQ